MTIRRRLTLWYSSVLLISTMLIAVLVYDELHERGEPPGKKHQAMEEFVSAVLWVALPAVVLSLVGGWWVMRKALAPLATLTEAARRVNELNLHEQLPRTHNRDELDQLAEVLNAMTARLNSSFTRIRDFTLHASHELKTPLTVLCGEAETELRDETLTPIARERLASRLDELQRLSRIVDGLTLLAKADAGLISLERKLLRLNELVEDGFAEAQILGEASALNVKLLNCEPALISGHPHRLRQLLLNLVDNAVKYNEPGGAITMALARVNNIAELKISNTGPGIPDDALPRVFERFFRVAVRNGHVEGCGLGLSIAQWIVAAHSGTIQIECSPAKLTTVTVRLPLSTNPKPSVELKNPPAIRIPRSPSAPSR